MSAWSGVWSLRRRGDPKVDEGVSLESILILIIFVQIVK